MNKRDPGTPVKDESGMRYGRWTVLRRDGSNNRQQAMWLCRCDCGTERRLTGSSLRRGKSTSCGCRQQPPEGLNPDREPSVKYGGSEAIEEAGHVYGCWTIMSRANSDAESAYWLCRCVCGTESIIRGTALRTGESQSCGCQGKNPQDAAVCILWRSYRFSASKRNLTFALTKQEFLDLTSAHCYYCGIAPSKAIRSKGNGEYYYNGIDRRDNTKGYTIDNCVPCCPTCNMAKRTMPVADFEQWIARVYHYLTQQGRL